MGREVCLRARGGVYVSVVALYHLDGIAATEVIANHVPEGVGGPGHDVPIVVGSVRPAVYEPNVTEAGAL